eukprot:scaffold162271_cov20-Tisochrysis_lutea.AAC.2
MAQMCVSMPAHTWGQLLSKTKIQQNDLSVRGQDAVPTAAAAGAAVAVVSAACPSSLELALACQHAREACLFIAQGSASSWVVHAHQNVARMQIGVHKIVPAGHRG